MRRRHARRPVRARRLDASYRIGPLADVARALAALLAGLGHESCRAATGVGLGLAVAVPTSLALAYATSGDAQLAITTVAVELTGEAAGPGG